MKESGMNPRIDKLAELLVNYCVTVQPGHKVAIQGETSAEPLIMATYAQVLKAGGFPHLLLRGEGQDRLFFEHAHDAHLDYVSPFSRLVVETFDAMISISGARNTRELSNVDPARQQRLARASSEVRETLMARTARGEMNWTIARYPTNAHAMDADMSLREYEDFVYSACHVTAGQDPVAHWRGVHAEHERLIAWLKGRKQVEVRSPDIDLKLSIADRVVLNADGRRNMPDGEIFTAPVEDTVEGWVRFTYPAIFSGREVTGVEVKFEQGKVVSARAKKGEDFLLQVLDTDAGARYLGEFAIGTNYGVTRFSKDILFDEKIGGTVHMAFGRAYPESGGVNQSAVHWDMICDMRTDSEIVVDGEVFYRNGQFVV
jgi:aminopeptidase